MATFEQIYEIESPIEQGFETVLVAAGVTVRMPATYVNDDQESADSQSEENTSGSVKIQLEITGANYDHTRPSQVNGQTVEDTFDGNLIAEVVTDRNQNSSSHRALIAKVRYALLTMDLAAFNTAQSYHNLLMLTAGGSSHSEDDENNLDITRLTFPLMVQVKGAAWPTP